MPPSRNTLSHANKHRRRKAAAKMHLRLNLQSFQEIGYRMGYVEPASFSKAFKHYHGISPRAYRVNARQFLS